MTIGWFSMTPPVLYTIGGVFTFLAIATIVRRVLAIVLKKELREVQLRIRTWWIMVAILTVALTTNQIVTLVFFALVSFLALKEFLSLIPARKADRRVFLAAYLLIPVQYFWVHSEWYGMFIVFIPVYAFMFLPLLMVGIGETEGFLRAVGTLHWGLMTTLFSISHTAYLIALPDWVNPVAGSIGNVLFLIILTQFNDVAQFLWGKSFGRHKITPRVSPNKTWEGFLGGMASTMVLGYFLAQLLTPFNQWQSLLAAFAIAVSGFFGDVTLSAIKRDIKVKDSGELLPGHGGILDRIDSLTFSAPIFFHLLYWLHY